MNNDMNEKKLCYSKHSLKAFKTFFLQDNKVHIKILYVNEQHPFYNLQGSDNMIIIT